MTEQVVIQIGRDSASVSSNGRPAALLNANASKRLGITRASLRAGLRFLAGALRAHFPPRISTYSDGPPA